MNTLGPVHVVVPAYPETGMQVTIPAMQGMIVGVGVKYNLNVPYSTSIDFAITEIGDNQPDQDILAIASASTDGWFYPVASINGNDGSVVSDQYTFGVPVFGDVLIDIANGQPGDSVDFIFRLV